ncbi:hypothetical protein OG871_16715 [Kitasatospora sp. NBC_00374]|uniref:hypothetical protein n=1 Tax=Kitasatospora sp. NBC_00374 TaxID=2975964 RepID=UPI0030E2B0C9
MRKTTRTHLVLAAAVLAVSACGSGGPKAAEPVAAGAPLAGRDSIVVAWCDRFAAQSTTAPDTKVHVVTVVAHSSADGTRLAERSAALPDGAAVEPLCGQPRRSTAAADRQLFDPGFGLVAGTVPGPNGSAPVATAFTLPGGRAAVAEPAEGRGPAFQAGTSVLWYEGADHKVVSRDLAAAGAGPQDHGTAPGQDFALVDGRPWLTRPVDTKADQVAAAPGGEVAAGSGLWRRTDPAASYDPQYVEPAALGPSGNGRTTLPGSETVPGCAPRLWTDPRTLLCVNNEQLLLLTFAADHSRLEGFTSLLPPERRFVDGAVLSPDGRSLAYLDGYGGTTFLYRIDLTPGAQPVRLGPVATSTAEEQSAGLPHLVAWQ